MKQSIVKIGHGFYEDPQIATAFCLLWTVFKSCFFVLSPKRIYCPYFKKRVIEQSTVKIGAGISKNPQIAQTVLHCLKAKIKISVIRQIETNKVGQRFSDDNSWRSKTFWRKLCQNNVLQATRLWNEICLDRVTWSMIEVRNWQKRSMIELFMIDVKK